MTTTATGVSHVHHERADVFLVPVPSENIVHVAVRHIETSGDAWSIYGAISTTATLQASRRENVKLSVYAYVLSHPDDVDEHLLREAQKGYRAVLRDSHPAMFPG
ncbi:MAG TPA: hypothetical protein VMU95_28835 [Trebonia sp.]|nr:hypothetical protein [Trebonia sp.]